MAISAEDTIKGIIAEAKKGNVTDHQSDGTLESWKIPFNGSTYRVVVTDKKAKTGKAFNKNDLLVVGEDGSEKVVNLGEWKKKLFYTLVYALRKGKVFHKIDQDPAKVKAIKADMIANPGNYVKGEDEITGIFNGTSIKVTRTKKAYKSGKTLCRITLAEHGVVSLKGSQLQPLFKA